MTTPVAATISADDWRALARSAPWLWRSILCTITATEDTDVEGCRSMRVWTERQGGILAVDQDGEIVRRERRAQVRSAGAAAFGWTDEGTFAEQLTEELSAARGASRYRQLLAEAERRDDGLVVRRQAHGHDLETWLVHSYFWPAVMDPLELADGMNPETGDHGPGCDVTDLRVEVRDGREQWGATVTPLAAYDPLCSCCPLLSGRVANAIMAKEGWEVDPASGATAWEVWLDRGTGVITRLRELDGPHAGRGWDLVVEAVDEPCP